MPLKRRQFERPAGVLRYRKLYIVATEGTVTEPEYFAKFNSPQSSVWVNCLRGRHGSSPPQVLKRLTSYLVEKGLRPTDEAWLVVDKDSWTDSQLSQLWRWVQEANNRGLALSNPNFEYWLLLHFEDGTGIASARDCTQRLLRHQPGYAKHLDARKITPEMITAAIQRAKARDLPPCTDWPRRLGQTSVYRLVERIHQL